MASQGQTDLVMYRSLNPSDAVPLIEFFVEDNVSPSFFGKGGCRILDGQHQRIRIGKYLMLCFARDLEPRSFAVFQECVVNQNFARTRDEAQGRIVGLVMVSNVPVVRTHVSKVVARAIESAQYHVIFVNTSTVDFRQLRNRSADLVG